MAVSLTIQGVTYAYPTTGDEAWGQEASDWAVAVTSVLEGLVVPGDIGPTTLVSIANNQSSAANVSSLTFDSSTVRSAVVEYYVYKTYNSGTSEVVENGTMYLNFKDIANAWDMVIVGNNITGSGTTFNITAGGQVTYTSSNLLPATSYSGSMKFRARILNKT